MTDLDALQKIREIVGADAEATENHAAIRSHRCCVRSGTTVVTGESWSSILDAVRRRFSRETKEAREEGEEMLLPLGVGVDREKR